MCLHSTPQWVLRGHFTINKLHIYPETHVFSTYRWWSADLSREISSAGIPLSIARSVCLLAFLTSSSALYSRSSTDQKSSLEIEK
jgi:hypothetical protein